LKITIKRGKLSTDKQSTSWSDLFHHDDNTTPVSRRCYLLYNTTVTSYRLENLGFGSYEG